MTFTDDVKPVESWTVTIQYSNISAAVFLPSRPFLDSPSFIQTLHALKWVNFRTNLRQYAWTAHIFWDAVYQIVFETLCGPPRFPKRFTILDALKNEVSRFALFSINLAYRPDNHLVSSLSIRQWIVLFRGCSLKTSSTVFAYKLNNAR